MSTYMPIAATVYGRAENRLKVNSVLHLPLKAGNTVDTVDTSPQVFVVGTALTWYVAGSYYTPSGKPAILGNDYFTL
jgi:hypothetical protein